MEEISQLQPAAKGFIPDHFKFSFAGKILLIEV